MNRVASHGQVVEWGAGQTIFSQGEPCHQFYLVQRGMIKLYRISVDGTEKVMDLAGPQQSFAESAMFTGKYPLHATAIEPSTVFAFDCKDFMTQMHDNVELCFRLMLSMSQHLHGMINEIDRLTLHSGTQRLAEYLLEQVPEGVMQSPCIRLLVPKLVIASRLGIQPETFSRIMARLRSDGMIEMHNDTILLKDLGALRCLAACHG
ncbi:MAG: Crp/Fnr family transcriptional regulator [Sulfuricella sp.]|nr:Crp/Fnr family transcriptional regulator [Sulfuricella sp.]